jgi:hypothetical protein
MDPGRRPPGTCGGDLARLRPRTRRAGGGRPEFPGWPAAVRACRGSSAGLRGTHRDPLLCQVPAGLSGDRPTMPPRRAFFKGSPPAPPMVILGHSGSASSFSVRQPPASASPGPPARTGGTSPISPGRRVRGVSAERPRSIALVGTRGTTRQASRRRVPAAVMVEGEAGSAGVLARLIPRVGPRRGRPFLALSCSGQPDPGREPSLAT